MKVSVVIPFYNVEKYIRKCLESLKKQTLQDIEFILVNDGSKDNSEEIVKEYLNDSRFKLLKKENGGLSDARNFGFLHITGQYTAFLDSDDYVDETMYETMYEDAKKHNADVVECDFIWEYPNKKIIDANSVHHNLILDIRVVAWNKLYNTKFLKSLHISFTLGRQYEDVSYCYKIVPYIKVFRSIKKPFVHYIQRSNSISNKQNEKVRDIFHILDETVEYYKQHNLYENYQKELEYLHIRYILGSSFKRVVMIPEKSLRKKILLENWDYLHERYPHWKQNSYLKSEKSKKNYYFQHTNKTIYLIFAKLYRLFK